MLVLVHPCPHGVHGPSSQWSMVVAVLASHPRSQPAIQLFNLPVCFAFFFCLCFFTKYVVLLAPSSFRDSTHSYLCQESGTHPPKAKNELCWFQFTTTSKGCYIYMVDLIPQSSGSSTGTTWKDSLMKGHKMGFLVRGAADFLLPVEV